MTMLRISAAIALLVQVAITPAIALAQSGAVDAAYAAAQDWDHEGARAILVEACDSSDAAACRVLLADLAGSYESEDEVAARALAGRLCGSGDMLACVTLARYAEGGRGGAEDRALQQDTLVTACRGGFASACLQAAYLAEQGPEGGEPDMTLAREMAGKGCAAGDAQSCSIVGNYLQSSGWDDDSEANRNAKFEQARRAFTRGCELGDLGGCMSLSSMMLEGRGGPADRAGAVAMLEERCAKDYYACETLLGALDP